MMEFDPDKLSELMNLVGYGLAKFDVDFVKEFGFSNKTAFSKFIVDLGVAKTYRAVMNRQDSFDPYFDNGRRGWFQRNQREHIKLFIDSLFGNENVNGYANVVKIYMRNLNIDISLTEAIASPIIKSKFKQLQETGREAEFYFMNNYSQIPRFENGILEDARLWGDGYDFQIKTSNNEYLLAEIKGLRERRGTIRLTQNEYDKAVAYKNDFILVIISNLSSTPHLNYYENPLLKLNFTCKDTQLMQINYYSDFLNL